MQFSPHLSSSKSQPAPSKEAPIIRRFFFGKIAAAGFVLTLLAGPLGCSPDAVDAEDDAALASAPVHFVPQSIPAGYYDSTVGKTGAALLQALADRTFTGHTPLSYTGARERLFADAEDYNNDDKVDCVYTGRWASPVNSINTALSFDFNTEHSWPQSLGATGSAQTDLNHLFAVDETTNGRRANYPFGVVKTVTWTAPNPDGTLASKLGTDAAGHLVFEPHDKTKGDIARAIFYFYTRYNTRRPSKYTLTNFTIEKATLRKWHAADPPDAEERARNDLVYGIQGNRNPYIDHPEFIDAIPDFP